jgi:trimethylamine--corrinoid protein Co-methyltransferase
MRPIQLTVLTEDEKQTIHEATLEILETVGVRVFDDDLRTLLRDRGARVDDVSGHVRLESALVLESLALAPGAFDLANREGERLSIPAEGAHIGSRLLSPKMLGYRAEKPRDPVISDIIKSCQIANALDDIHVVLRTDTPVSDIQTPPELNGLLSIQIALTYSAKHFLCLPISYESFRDWVALAEAATETGDLSVERVLSAEVTVTSPLQIDRDSCQVLMLAARKGMPVWPEPMPAGGGTAPVTTAGQLVQFNAEALFTIVATQLVRPGCPVFYSGIPCTFDLRTGLISEGSPEFPPLVSATLEMGRFYRLPLLSPSKYTDSITLDEQCAAEKIMSAFASLASGADIVYGCGDLDNAVSLSLEQIVIDLDLILAARRFVQGIVLDDDRLALGVIKRVGPGGHYLEDEHTLRYMRSEERFVPQSYNRLGHRSRAKMQLERAHQIVEEIVSRPAEPAITPAAAARIQSRVEERKREITAAS